ncbi:hypothetical protein [Streptomyces sp. MZ04]|uniref:hypothetical protein n=1 Tax=Streptomyces sp. MZ04 TaxID=2559236 RepID=UPI00107EC436|nr:hypothetical protein [Streptomyces sp. MZ04]TGB13585.1 hypothetical protein E2651_08940 [Streptomyces sp. MZ04]
MSEERAADPLAYRVVLPIRDTTSAEVFDQSRAVLGNWLSSKGYPWSPASGLSSVGDGTTLSFASTYRDDGTQQGMRAQLTEVEPEQGRTWRTTVTAARPEHSTAGGIRAWVAVELECLLEPGRPWPRTNPPRLIRELVERLPVDDAGIAVDAQPLRVGPRQVAELVDVLCEPDRALPVLVAVQPSQSSQSSQPSQSSRSSQPEHEQWERELGRLARRVCGVAMVYHLSPEAAAALNRELTFHGVGPGSVRTFLTGVDPASAADSGRHRVMSFQRLRQDPGPAYRILTLNGHTPALRRPLPRTLGADAFPEIDPAEWSRLRGAEESARKTVSLDADAGATLSAELRTTSLALTGAVRQLERLESELRHERLRAQELEVQYQQADGRADDEVADHDHTTRQLSFAEQRVRELQRRLSAAEAAEEAWRSIELDDDPLSIEAFLDLLGGLPYVEFSGRRDDALELDDHMKASTWAAKAWRAARALNDYAHRRVEESYDRNFREFCLTPPQGVYTVSANQVALRESDSVASHAKMRAQRELPVPASVNPTKKIFMGAHLKLDHKGTVSPRLHFHDDTGGATGKIWIGYLGPHLTTTLSN